MPRGKQSKGQCAYCRHETIKGAMNKHLSACPQCRAMIEQAESSKSKSETLYHLRVQAAYQNEFWLDLEMRSSARLKDLDHYLRAIWLECCGHLSGFSIGGWGGEEIAQDRKTKAVFKPGVQLTHIYDFGASSETLINVVGTREGKPTTVHPIALMARNLRPEAQCIECDKPAAWLCTECLVEHEVWGMLCDAHAQTHPHDNYGEPVPLVNSPRQGLCGYDGPAAPPY